MKPEKTFLKTYHIKHKKDFSTDLKAAKEIADYAVQNKYNNEALSTKFFKHLKMHSDVVNQILRKYGRGPIKEAKNINLIVPNVDRRFKNKAGEIKIYNNIEHHNGIVKVKPLNLSFRWNPGKEYIKIHQIEIDNEKYMISVGFPIQSLKESQGVLGIDLNCGVGRHVANCANLETGEILNLGRQGPNIRKMYYKKRQGQKMKGHKEKRIMKDLDHKISRKIVNYALKEQLKIVVENLTNIRTGARRGKGSRTGNRFVNSWSFYRLQSFIEYKAKELGIPFEKINPHYTSQECSYCGNLGTRERESFICKNKRCKKGYKRKRHADINAAFNIAKRSLQKGGRA